MAVSTVELVNRQSTAKRVVLFALGVIVIVWPIIDLWRGIASFSAISPLLWVIGLGALGLGSVLISGAILGESTVLTVAQQGNTLMRETLLHRRTASFLADDVVAIQVEAHEWSDGPTNYRVKLTFRGMKPILSEEYSTRDAAEALADRLRQALGRGAN